MNIYVCHSYGRRQGLSGPECLENVWKSIEWGRKIIKMGHNPFIPNLYHYVHSGWEASPEEPVWLELVMEWLAKCDAVFVASSTGRPNSGVRQEISLAHVLKIPVYYSISEIPPI